MKFDLRETQELNRSYIGRSPFSPQKSKKSTSDECHHTDRFHTGEADAVRGHSVFSQDQLTHCSGQTPIGCN